MTPWKTPIEIEQPAEGSGQTVREDGSVVFDVLAPPCPADHEPVAEDEIVVCAASPRTAEFEAEAAARNEPEAVKIKLGENADATLIGGTNTMPMGGNSQEATVRLRLGF